VVDESRFVAVDGGVDHDVVVDREQEGVVTLAFDVGITRLRLGWGQTFARILDEPRAGRDSTRRESTEPLDRRPADLEGVMLVGQGAFSVFGST
jgi:hypothetical protein